MAFAILLSTQTLAPASVHAADSTLLGWNDLGMHCMDADFAVFSILPPFNTIHAQFIQAGQLARSSNGLTVTYEAVADPAGSINRTSVGKGNFWVHAPALYGAALAPDAGLAGFKMPGANNQPQPMRFDAATGWFSAEGIPITPVDDTMRHNPYPMMRLVARDGMGTVLANTDIVLPVSDEMDCRACHASGANSAAQPIAGWMWDCDPQRDYRLNILQAHDELNLSSPGYLKALKEAGYDSRGLLATVQGTPVLCAKCHASNALPGTGIAGISPLTQAVHSWHAYMPDPDTGKTLEDTTTRAACYRCHPGSETRCLRGAMGSAVGANGARAMDCQSCHGSMSVVGGATRNGWLQEPSCQNCHSGTAVKNRGAIRFETVFDELGQPRTPADLTYATNPDVPVAGSSLFRFSRGHGGLYCSACHGSPHAEFPSTEPNDNAQSLKTQGHAGVIAECTACHPTLPVSDNGGPHGLHPLGSSWIGRHDQAAEANLNGCKACHGADLRGTVLSRMQADRTLQAFGAKTWWRGFQVGCFACHDGPDSEDGTANRPAQVTSTTVQTQSGQSVAINLVASDPDGNPLTLRIVSQPAHGTVALTNHQATYRPDPAYAGPDRFTFAAWDGAIDSNLGTVNVTVVEGDCDPALSVIVAAEVKPGAATPFRARARLTACAQAVAYEWNFGDGTPVSTDAAPCHAYSQPGTYLWQARATAGGVTRTLSGEIKVVEVTPANVLITFTRTGSAVTLAWPVTATGFEAQTRPSWGSGDWSALGQVPERVGDQFVVTVQAAAAEQYFRLRKAP